MTEKMCLDDWAPLFIKATTRRQLEAVFSALDSCYVEDRTTMSNGDWLLLRGIVVAALERVGEKQGGGRGMSMYPGTLYDYTAGVYCGVLVTERVMRKLAKLQQQHMESVKRLLHDNKEEVFPSMWTLHYPNGEQTNVHYIDTSANVENRIKAATTTNQPRARFPVFIAGTMDEARRLADVRFEEGGYE